jgi:hypothetical protein
MRMIDDGMFHLFRRMLGLSLRTLHFERQCGIFTWMMVPFDDDILLG